MTEPITDDVLLDFADALGDAPADTVLFRTANSNHDLFDMTAGMFTALLAELRQRRAAPAPQAVALTDEQRDELARVLSSRDSRWTHFDWDAQRDETRGYYRRIIDALAAAWPTPAPVPQQKVPPQDELELLLGDITRLLRCGNMLTYNDTGDDRPFCVTERTDRDDAVEVDGATLAEAVGAAIVLGMGECADSACPCGHTTPQPAPDADARALGRLAVAWRDAQLTRRKLVRSDNYEAYAAADDAEDMARDAFDAEIRRQVRMG